jgi:hypothetical protein
MTTGGHVAGIVAALLILLGVLLGIGLGIYCFVAESVWISAFGLPVQLKGVEKVILGLFALAPAVLLCLAFWTFRRGSRTH